MARKNFETRQRELYIKIYRLMAQASPMLYGDDGMSDRDMAEIGEATVAVFLATQGAHASGVQEELDRAYAEGRGPACIDTAEAERQAKAAAQEAAAQQ